MSTKQRQCRNNPDVFCYSGKYMIAKYQFNIRDFTRRSYEVYFGIKLGDQDKSRKPYKVNIVKKRCAFGCKAKSGRCGLGFLWYDVSPNITITIGIFAWWICLDGTNERRKIGIILILSFLDDPYHIALKFQFQFLLPYLTLLQMKCYWKRWTILIAATVALVALPAWLLQHLRSVQNQNLLVKAN